MLQRPSSSSASGQSSRLRARMPGGGAPPGAVDAPPSDFDGAWLWRQSLVMGAASAVLGPLCDGQHSAHDVLHYVSPAHLSLGPLLQLETCW